MIGYFLIGLLLAGLLLMLLNWWANAQVKSAKNSLMWMIAAVCAALAFILLATGKAILAAVPALFAVFRMFGPMVVSRLLSGINFGRFGAGSRAGQGGNNHENLSRQEALEVLGLDEGASEKEISEAYRRLMAQVHPDKGGSDWMAAKLNAARRTLLD